MVTGGYRRLQGGSADFLLQRDTQTHHHNIYQYQYELGVFDTLYDSIQCLNFAKT